MQSRKNITSVMSITITFLMVFLLALYFELPYVVAFHFIAKYW